MRILLGGAGKIFIRGELRLKLKMRCALDLKNSIN